MKEMRKDNSGSILDCMPRVFIPALLRPLTNGLSEIDVQGNTVHEAIDALESKFPGTKARLCNGDRLRPGLMIGVGKSFSPRGLTGSVDSDTDIHILPAISGG